MALKGKIDDFGIADIFQLIGQQQRSGLLNIQSNNKAAEITFVNGMISKANPIYLSPKIDPLGFALVKARLITEENLQRALKAQKESLKSLEETLLDLKLLSREKIQIVNENLILETLYDTLQWKIGEYEFTIKEVDHDQRFVNLMNIEAILLDILRMIDEEPELSQRIPHQIIVFQKTASTEEVLNFTEELGEYEQIVYKFVNGTNTVKDIIDQTILGRYNTTKALVNLLDAGYIKRVSVERIPSRKIIPRKNIFSNIAYGVLPIIIFLALLGFKLIIPSSPENLSQNFYKSALGKVHFQKIKYALNVYFLQKGKFPNTLEDLLKENLIESQDLDFLAGREYYLQKDGTYRLE